MCVYAKLLNVQTTLKAPKNQYNAFGKYKYRNCEDILEAVKPILKENKATLIITDEVVNIGERFYIKSNVSFVDIENKETITVSAVAREEESKKGMDGSQVTGATSSYSRKYALNGLFAIDDTKDTDSEEYKKESENRSRENKPKATPSDDKVTQEQIDELKALGGDIDTVSEYIKSKGQPVNRANVQAVIDAKKKSLNKESKGE